MIRLGLDDYRPQRAEQRQISLADFPWLSNLLAAPTAAGMAISEHTALNFSAYFNGVDIISGQIGITPRIPYKRVGDDERERATTHPTYKLLHDQPNPYATPAVFWQTLMAHVLTWGNGYAEIEFDNALRPIALWNLPPDRMEAKVENVSLGPGRSASRVYYVYAGQRRIEAEDVIHVPGLGYDGVRGYSVVNMARRSLGLAAAAEQYGASFFSNGASPAVVLEHPSPKGMSPNAKDNIKEAWDSAHGGPFRAGGTAILEEGMTAKVLGVPQKDAQFLESREFQIVEVARWLNLPPHKLKHKYGERPGGNLEAAQIEFLTDTLDPWYVKLEQECSRKLFPASQRSTYYVEHLTEARLRLDAQTKLNIQRGYWEMGVLNREQIAKQQNLPKPEPDEKPQAPPPAAPPAGEPPQQNGRLLSAQRGLILDAAARYVEREADDVRRAVRKGPGHLEGWLTEQNGKRAGLLASMLLPIVRVVLAHRGVEKDAASAAGEIAEAYVQRSAEELLTLPSRRMETAAEAMLTGWTRNRPEELAEAVLGYREAKPADPAHAPVVNVTVNVPEQPPAAVNVTVPVPSVRVEPQGVTVNVPPQRAPDVNVTTPTPIVRVDNTVNVPAPRRHKVERDAFGNLSGLVPE